MNTTIPTKTKRMPAWLNKGVVGYVLLAAGCAYAIHGNNVALSDSKDRGQKARAVICNILTESDEQSIEQLPASSKLLHISEDTLNKYLKKQLQTSAKYRAQLAPSTPGSACEHGITTKARTPALTSRKAHAR